MTSENEKFEQLLNDLVYLSGKDREEIRREWKNLFQERDKLIEAVRNTNDFNQLDEILQQQEADLEFEIFWIRHVFKAAAELNRARNMAKKAKATLTHLNFLKIRREVNDVYVKYRINDGYSEDVIRREITTSPHEAQAYSIISDVEDLLTRKSISKLGGLVRRYRWRRKTRTLKRFGIRMFWGLLVVTLGVNAITSAIPVWYIVLILTIIVWFLQEYLFTPWLERKLFERYRSDLLTSVRELYAAKFQANGLIMAQTPYLDMEEFVEQKMADESKQNISNTKHKDEKDLVEAE